MEKELFTTIKKIKEPKPVKEKVIKTKPTIEEIYSDNRHPESVTFTTNLREDLSRRDFTVNAIAYNEEYGIADFYGGESDLKKRLIRCVGNPDERFREDALRILRALRFASCYSFSIETETAAAIHRNAGLLKNIAVERVQAELTRLLCGRGVAFGPNFKGDDIHMHNADESVDKENFLKHMQICLQAMYRLYTE